MENNNVSKVGNFLKKMFHFRVKVDRKGEPIVNVSSIFGLACLLFAPHMTIVGVVASLLLGYQIRFESEGDDRELEEKIRKAAQNVKAGAMSAAKTIQSEISKARTENAPARNAAEGPQMTQQEAVKAAEQIVQQAQTAATNDELLRDLQSHAQETMESNPAATTFHSAYAASAGSVPVLRVNEEPTAPEPSVPAAKGANE